jgi:hypothetical protein
LTVARLLAAYAANAHHGLDLNGVFKLANLDPEWFAALALPQGVPAAFEKLLKSEAAARPITKKQEEARSQRSSYDREDWKSASYHVDEAAYVLTDMCRDKPDLYANVTQEQLAAFSTHKFGILYGAIPIMEMVEGNTEREIQLTADNCLPSVLKSMFAEQLVRRPNAAEPREYFYMPFIDLVSRFDACPAWCDMAARPDLLPRLLAVNDNSSDDDRKLADQTRRFMIDLRKLKESVEAGAQGVVAAQGGGMVERPGMGGSNVVYDACKL